ncbi:unnamed protein product [Prorocentrum cordatum]|uniref:Uncharacterized protein n=1 Tax=Prorocentrum cordatum TaxID=2364126 RepID=A0ABN9QZN2_9DINO|nr:unnamed protein product [Polarella glacialis]
MGLKAQADGTSMAFAAWLAGEAVHGAGQAALLWAARGECPACTCAPALTRAPGQEAARVDCPGGSPGWALSAVALAGVTGFAGGLLAASQSAGLCLVMASSAAAAAASGHPLALDGLDEGDFILVLYRVGGGRIWHERLVLAFQTVPPFGTGVLTPDGHAYVEAIMQNGADIREYAIPAGAAAGAVAAAAAGGQALRLALGLRGPPLRARPAALLGLWAAWQGERQPSEAAQQPRQLAQPPLCQWRPHLRLRQEELQLSCPLPGGAAVAVPAPGPAAAPAPAAGGGPGPGGVAAALAAIAGAPGGDARIQSVAFDAQGVRYVDFRAAAVRLHELPWGDWPLKGPRTLLWVLSFICRNGGTPLGRHTKWVSEGYLEADDPGVDAHLLCCRLLELGVVYDQLHVTNIAAMELVGRTLQTQEELYRDRFAASSEFGSDAALVSGALDAGGNVCVAPALRDWLAAEKAREANIAKERRKAIMHITDSIDELGRPPSEFMSGSAAEDGALRELLSCANLYGTGAATSTPYVSDRVAWPAAGGTPVGIVELVPPVDRVWLEGWRSHMLRDPRAAAALAREACPKGPFCDPALMRDVSTYGRFLIQMYERQMVNFAADSGMYMSTCDLECAFYHMRLPEGMEVMFTLPPILAGVLQELGLMDLDFDPLVSLSPQDGHPGVNVVEKNVVGVAAYVDNILVFGGCKSLVDETMTRLVGTFRRRGLPVHEIEPAALDADFLGLSLRGGRYLRIKPRNIWRLHSAISSLLRRGWCSGHMLRAVLGHITWTSMIRREVLTVLHSSYGYVGAFGPRHGKLWPSVIKRWRYKVEGGRQARLRSLKEHLGSLGSHALKNPEDIQEAGTLGVHGEGLGIPVEHNKTEALRFSMDPWELDEVPGHITRKEAWKSVSAQSVSLGANILYLEGEALVTSYRHLLRNLGSHGKRMVALVDNLPLALSCTKGRARSSFLSWVGSAATVILVMLGRLAGGCVALSVLLVLITRAEAMPRQGSRTPSALTRHRAILAAKAAGGRTGTLAMSLLEQQAVRLNTEALYRQPLHTFVSYCADRHLDWSTLGQLDSILAEYLTARHPAQRLTPDSIVQPSIGAGAAYQFWGLLLRPADRGQGGMTGAFDASIPLDLDLYLVPVLMALRLKGPVATPLWGVSLGQLNLLFFLAATTLGINHLRPHLFRMRHGGVSYDLLTQRRSMERVCRRGRWAVMSSMRRYAKETALLRELQDGAEGVYAFGHLVEGRFCELLEMGFLRNWCLAQVPSQLVEAMQLCGPARGRRVVVELFSGSGHFTAAVRRLGLSGLGLDIRRGPLEDHLDATFEEVIVGCKYTALAAAYPAAHANALANVIKRAVLKAPQQAMARLPDIREISSTSAQGFCRKSIAYPALEFASCPGNSMDGVMALDCEDGVIVLDEKPLEEFNPTSEEVRSYAEWLGLDPDADEGLMYLAREGLKAPLTEGWKACQNADGEIFYFNFQTGESTWDHPSDEKYRQLVQEKKQEQDAARRGGVGDTPVLQAEARPAARKRPRRARGAEGAGPSDEDVGEAGGAAVDGDEASSAKAQAGQRPQKKPTRAQRNAICFRYFRGSCKFDDCKFQHVAPGRLTPDEQAQVLRELPLREFDQRLADVVQKMNIPRCKDFHLRGGGARL